MAAPRSLKTRAYDGVFRLRSRHPALEPVLHAVNRVARVRPPVRFQGWGLTTTHEPPWRSGGREARFRGSLEEVRRLAFTGEAGISAEDVDQLEWRHWVVTFCARYAATMAQRPEGAPVEAAEFGVADGTTAFFALRELERVGARMHLFDAWDAIKRDSLLATEAVQAERYGGLSLDKTKANLSAFEDQLTWHVGYVPETMDPPGALPDRLDYVHIDLNASQPTLAVCERVWPRLAPGGVLLFDDYGWLGFEDTKRVVDDFTDGKPGVLLTFPTAQAVFLRSAEGVR